MFLKQSLYEYNLFLRDTTDNFVYDRLIRVKESDVGKSEIENGCG